MSHYKVTGHQLDDSVTYCIYCNFGADFVSEQIIRMGSGPSTDSHGWRVLDVSPNGPCKDLDICGNFCFSKLKKKRT